MGITGSQLQPRELATFKKLPTGTSLSTIEIPERAENRRPTNVKWLIILGVFIVILLPFLIYTLYYSDITRILAGYDKCGNTCGKKNYQWEGINCSGKDLSSSPFLEYEQDFYGPKYDELIDLKERRCVAICKEGYVGFFGKCLKKFRDSSRNLYTEDDFTLQSFDGREVDLGVYFAGVKWQLIISCLLSILVSMGMLFLFRYAVAYVVWGILLGCLFGLCALVGAMWYFYSVTSESFDSRDRDSKQAFLAMAITFTIVAVVVAIVLVWCRKKVRLVIMLLKEATKAVFDMPGLIAVPVVCVVTILILMLLFLLTTLFMVSAGTLQLVRNDFYAYQKTPVMTFTMAYNFLVYLWLTQFFTGIQYMIIAGAVSKWYFARDKNFLGKPILTSMAITFKYHLGTVALGSLLITMIQVIKMVIMSVIKSERIRICVRSCIESIETFFKFLSKNAYIVTAMHGQAFLRSGKRAAKLIIQNVGDIIAVNYIGDFVLGMAKILIIVVTLLLTAAIFAVAPGPVVEASQLPAFVLVGIISAVVACVSFGVFETAIDTLFVCYCEDKLLNNGGASKPYYMSRNLQEFVQESKKIYEKK